MSIQHISPSAKKIIDIAASQVGYHEGRSGGYWNNHQKYSPAIPGLEWSQNQSWCATFVSWLAMKAGFADLYPRTASCDVAGKWFKDRHRWSEYPAVGAQVFYGSSSDLSHTGLVVDFDATHIWTIEGNTNTNGSAQGDGVYRLRHDRSSARIVGYGLPKFPEGILSADPAFRSEAPKAAPATPVSPAKPRPTVSLWAAKKVAKRRGWIPLSKAQAYARYRIFSALRKEKCGVGRSGYQNWQHRLGYHGADADGIPGHDSLVELGKRYGFHVSL